MRVDKKPEFSDEDNRQLVLLREHAGWDVFIRHLKKQIDTCKSINSLPIHKGDTDEMIAGYVRASLAKASVYSGLIGFMNERKDKVE